MEAQSIPTLDPTIDQGDAQEPVQPAAPEQEKTEDVIDVIQPKAAVKTWVIGPEGNQIELVQRPLGVLKKMQWFALVGEVIDKAMSGPNPLQLGSLFSTPSFNVDDFREADMFVQAVGKLISYAPDFLERSFCIWLNVPDYRQDIVIQMLNEPPENGGLSDSDGIEIIEIFIDQNYEAIQSFFTNEFPKLRKRIEIRQKAATDRA